MSKIKIPVILGPTASGKSSLAVEICEKFNMSLISCDSRQIYRGMDIGTAKPSLKDQQKIKHYMIDIKKPNEEYSAYFYQKDVMELIKRASEDEKFLICGGTGLYYEALSKGMGTQVSADPEIVKFYTEQAENYGREFVHSELHKIDPETAKKLHPNDLQRVIRALVVFSKEGKSIQELQKFKQPPENIEFTNFILLPERNFLYNRINSRVDAMVKAGLFNEYYSLRERGYDKQDPGMRSVGYQELFLEKEGVSKKEIVEKIKQNSRKYAKRQFTWFRNRESGIVIDTIDSKSIKEVYSKIKKMLVTVN